MTAAVSEAGNLPDGSTDYDALVGMVLLLKNRFAIEDVRILLESAGDDNPAAAHGFAVSAGLLADIDERLPRAVLRCAFAARTELYRDWGKPEAEHIARTELYSKGWSGASEVLLGVVCAVIGHLLRDSLLISKSDLEGPVRRAGPCHC